MWSLGYVRRSESVICVCVLTATVTLSVLAIIPALVSAAPPKIESRNQISNVRVIQHNVRYWGDQSSSPPERWTAEHYWDIEKDGKQPRQPKAAAILKSHTVDHDESFICLQEVNKVKTAEGALQNQIKGLVAYLNNGGFDPNTVDEILPKREYAATTSDSNNVQQYSGLDHFDTSKGDTEYDQKAGDWTYIGVGRSFDDDEYTGEMSPIIYNRKVWELNLWRTSWLASNASAKGSKSFGKTPRICTQGVFKMKKTDKKVVVFSCHLDAGDRDHDDTRQQEVKVIRDVLLRSHTDPVIIGLDFNGNATYPSYKNMNVYDPETKSSGDVLSAREWTTDPKLNPSRDNNTYLAFDNEYPDDLIDFVLAYPKEKWQFTSYDVTDTGRYEQNGFQESDHTTQVADASLL